MAGGFNLKLDKQRRLQAVFWQGLKAHTVQGKQELSEDWHHVALTSNPADNGKLRLYVDGVPVAQQDAVSWGTPAGEDLFLGGRGRWAYRGSIDEVRVYNRALNAEEVKDLSRIVPPESRTGQHP